MPKRSTWAALVAAIILAGLVAATGTNDARAKEKTLFVLSDPRGDDHGDGTMTYPLSSEFRRGDLDLVELTARAQEDGTLFEATFARNVRVADRRAIDAIGTTLDSVARFKIYTLNIDIYIDQDHQEGSGNVAALPGRDAEIDPRAAWEKAVVLTPRPFEARAQLRTILTRSAKDRMRENLPRVDPGDVAEVRREISTDVERLVFFPTRIRVLGRRVRFFVPNSFLGGPARADWTYVVAVSASDLYSSLDLASRVSGTPSYDTLMILPVSPGRSADALGTTRDFADLLPPLMDIVVPPGKQQERVLSDYDARAGRRVLLPGVTPAEGR